MNYFDYLKKNFPFYIIGGVILCVAVFSLILIQRYNNHLSNVLSDLNSININKLRVKKQIKEIDALIEHFKSDHDLDITDFDYDALILRSLDTLKRDLGKATVQVYGFQETAGERKLPVQIEVPVSSYRMIIDYVEYIESFRMPNYQIERLLISKDQAGRIILNIKGAFVMPSLQANALRTEISYG